jgi:hypothetical protein
MRRRLHQDAVEEKPVPVKEVTTPELVPLFKELALQELRRCGGLASLMYRTHRFDSRTIARYRRTDPEFDAQWVALKREFPRQNRHKDSPQMRDKFLACLRDGYSPTKAAKEIGLSYMSAKAWKAKDREFSIEWDEAMEEGTDSLEDEARRRAVDGVARPVFQRGEHVGDTQEYSDGLLVTLLQARRPWKFKKFQDVNPNIPPPSLSLQADLSKMTAVELAQLYRETLGALNGEKPGGN